MQESCPPPGPPRPSTAGRGWSVDIYKAQGRKRNFAALHPRLKMHRVTATAVATAVVLPDAA